MSRRAVVLLSAGLDSSTNLFMAHQKDQVVLALTFDYGQRAAAKEIQSASELARYVGVPHKVVKLDFFKTFGQSSLLDQSKNIPTGTDVNIESLETSHETAKSVWVPNRNGIFLNIAAGFAEALAAGVVIPGFNIEEAATFPDNTNDFMSALTQSFSFSTANRVQVECSTVGMNKTEIMKKAIELQLPFEKIWPCYFSFDQWCGECESCLRTQRAMLKNGIELSRYFKGAK